VLCSSSRRTCETLEGIRPTFGRRARVETNSKLYGASAGHLISELQRLDDQVATVFLIGHNPGVEDLVDLLVPGRASGREEVEKFPTGTIAVLSAIGPWSTLQPGKASLDSFWTPRPPR
jgi:phosphohistidine phosphatase